MGFILAAIILALCLWPLFRGWLKRQGRHEGDGEGGFRDWVKNPEWREAVEDELTRKLLEQKRKREEPVVPLDLPEEEIKVLVEGLLHRDQDDFEGIERLERVGAKAVPALLQALVDSRFHRGRFTDSAEERTPFQIVVYTLQPYRPAEAVPLIAPFVRHQDEYNRKAAGEVLAEFGYGSCIEPVSIALSDEDDYVRDDVLEGICKGIKNGNCEPTFRTAIFERVVPLLARRDSTVGGAAPRTLLELDRERAIPVLLSEEFFTVANRELHYILRTLSQENIPIDRERLLGVMKELRPLAGDYPYDYSFAECLILLAQAKDREAEKWAREGLLSPSEKVREEAGHALGILHGIKDPHGYVNYRMGEVGYEGLTPPQQALHRVHMLTAEVRNGGLSQYFVNSSGDLSHETLRDLEVIGLTDTHRILHEAMQLFGSKGPSSNRNTRGRQLAALTKQQDATLGRLDSEFYKNKDHIDTTLWLYAIDNKNHFVPPTS
jgi:hypothetical protein